MMIWVLYYNGDVNNMVINNFYRYIFINFFFNHIRAGITTFTSAIEFIHTSKSVIYYISKFCLCCFQVMCFYYMCFTYYL